jgi:tryptophan-rich sensory protein
MIARFSDATGRRRPVVVTVPVLTPRLASHWVGLVTPISASLAKPLVGSLVHEVVAKERDIDDYVDVPGGYIDFDTAVQAAMRTAKPDTALRNLALTSAATAATAVVGSLATQPDSSYYRSLDLPDWQPPAVAFPVVWTALYADIAGSSAAVLNAYDKDGDEQGRSAYLKAFGTNLAINAAWSAVFWRSRRPWAAAVHAALLTASSADLARRAGRTSKGAGLALSPYAVWCGFATVLSAAIARRNPRP